MPWTAPPKMPLAQLPALLVTVFLAESMKFGSMFSLSRASLIQFTAAWTWRSMVDHCWMTPTVMRPSRAKAPTTMSIVTSSAPQALPMW